MPANVIALGAAWQRGAVPLSLAAIEEGGAHERRSVDQNLAAFAGVGRAWPRRSLSNRHIPGVNGSGTGASSGGWGPREGSSLAAGSVSSSIAWSRAMASCAGCSSSECPTWSRTRAALRVALRRRCRAGRAVESERLGDSTVLAEAVARNLYS